MLQNFLHFPSWLSGFIDGEGCFSISFTKRSRNNLGIDVKPSFSLSQHIRSEKCLYTIHSYLQCGGIRFDKHNQSYKFEVRSLNSLTQFIIPHFEKYPLLTHKLEDFKKFHYICFLMKQKLHLNFFGLSTILDVAFSMNPTGKRKQSKLDLLSILSQAKTQPNLTHQPFFLSFNEFLDKYYVSPLIPFNYPSWLTGFIDGEGCFTVSFLQGKTKLKLIMSFQVDQYETSLLCMNQIKTFFACGYLIHRKTKMLSFRINSPLFLKTKIIPHFEKYPLLTSKNLSFEKFKQIFDLTQGKALNYSDPQLNQLISLVYDLNPSGKRLQPLKLKQDLLSLCQQK